MTPAPDSGAATPRGFIHDLGYRGYDGPRRGTAQIARSLYVAGLLHAFGLRRSGRSKWLPFALLGANLLPAIVVVGAIAVFRVDQPLIGYADYAQQTQVLVSIFAAAQAPVLFSRDLRFGSIVLYLARPLNSTMFAMMRWLSLTTAIAIMLVTPLVLIYLGALLGRLDLATQSRQAGSAVLVSVLLAATVAGITGLISSLSTRRGFAVVISIAVLILGNGVVAVVQALALEEGSDTLAQIAGVFSPFGQYIGIAHMLDATALALAAPVSGSLQILYVVVGLATPVICVALLIARFAKVAAR